MSRKGSAWEREAARMFSMWLSRGADDGQLWRSVGSGGWPNRGPDDVGDLRPMGKVGARFLARFKVECKHVKAPAPLDFWRAFNKARRADLMLIQWWLKIHEESSRSLAEPMLLVKRTSVAVLLGVRPTLVDALPVRPVGPVLTITDGDRYAVTFVGWESWKELDPDCVIEAADRVRAW